MIRFGALVSRRAAARVHGSLISDSEAQPCRELQNISYHRSEGKHWCVGHDQYWAKAHGAAVMGNERKWTVIGLVRRKGETFFSEHGKWGEYSSAG